MEKFCTNKNIEILLDHPVVSMKIDSDKKNIISVKNLVALYNKISGKNISYVVDSSKKRKRDIKNFKPLLPVPSNWKENVGLNEILKNYLEGK